MPVPDLPKKVEALFVGVDSLLVAVLLAPDLGEVGEAPALRAAEAKRAGERIRLPNVGLSLVKTTLLAEHLADGAEFDSFDGGIAERSGKGEAFPVEGGGLVILAELKVDDAKTVQGPSLPVSVVKLSSHCEASLKAGNRLKISELVCGEPPQIM